ncbi:MAG: Gfo/Idh/MocA family protein, partial [Thermoproteota archaeon]
MDVHWELYVEPQVKEWRLWDERTGGGVFQDHGCHYVDLFRWWTGDEVEFVSAETTRLVADRKFEDHAVAILRFRKGAIGVIETSKDIYVQGLQEYGWIHANKGYVHFDSPPWNSFDLPRLRLSKDIRDAGTQINVELRLDILKHSTYMFKREIDHFVDCIKRDVDPIVTGADGRAAIEVVLAAYRSQEKSQKIRLPLA